MRAAVFPRPEACEVMEREDLLPGEGEVVVRVEACGVCGTDAHIYRGEFPARFPLVAGHEFAGVVERTGPGVASLRVGDQVVVDPNVSCGVCRPCRRGLVHLCRDLFAYGVTADGGFATHCLLPARQCYRFPAHLPFPVAAMAEPVACCVHGIERAGIRPGEVVVLIGAGMIGLILLQLALLQGAAFTIVSEFAELKRTLAAGLGAARVVDPQREDLAQVVHKVTEGVGADVVIDCVGGATTAQQALELVGEGGRVLLFGVAPESDQVALRPYDVYRREITLTGSFTNPFTHASALGLLASGRVQVADMISHEMGLDEVQQAVHLLESRQATKIVIRPQG